MKHRLCRGINIVCVGALIAGLVSPGAYVQQDNRFVYAQVQYQGEWDPYPGIHHEILSFLVTTTSINVIPERKVVSLDSDDLFEYPFIIMLGSGSFPLLDDAMRKRMQRYCEGGGLMFVEDSSGISRSSFDQGFRSFVKETFNDASLQIISREHAVMRSFYLLNQVGGRTRVNNYLMGLDINRRTCLIYSMNDIFGAWARDRLGNYMFICEPGGEMQRKESLKLTANIIMFALTGTYKTDAIHMPFILQKMRSHPY